MAVWAQSPVKINEDLRLLLLQGLPGGLYMGRRDRLRFSTLSDRSGHRPLSPREKLTKLTFSR